jgi:hypothetical protein
MMEGVYYSLVVAQLSHDWVDYDYTGRLVLSREI